jgi:cation:H+ antiporter
MTILSAVFLLIGCFALMTAASFILGGSIAQLIANLSLSGGLLGIISALGADAPEISSAFTALSGRQHEIGVGIIIGSNIFNLSILLGLSALISGKLPVKRQSIILNGAVSLLAILIMILLLFQYISPSLSIILLMFLLVPYVSILELKPDRMKQWKFPEKARNFISAAANYAKPAAKESKTDKWSSWYKPWIGGLAVIVIIGTSIGMVKSAIFLSNAWSISQSIVGMFVLATLTSIPNVILAVKLALNGRGTAVISESLNSNNLNIILGISVPAIILGIGSLARQTIFSIWWLLGTTIIALLLSFFKKGFNRMNGSIIVGLYLLFVIIIMVLK